MSLYLYADAVGKVLAAFCIYVKGVKNKNDRSII